MIPHYLDMLGFLSCSYQCKGTINAFNTQNQNTAWICVDGLQETVCGKSGLKLNKKQDPSSLLTSGLVVEFGPGTGGPGFEPWLDHQGMGER